MSARKRQRTHNRPPDPDVQAVLDGYLPKVLSPAQWDLAAPAMRAAVLALGPASAPVARAHLSVLARFLAVSGAWDGRRAPNLQALLTAARVEHYVRGLVPPGADGQQRRRAVHGAARARGQLRRLGRAVHADFVPSASSPRVPAPVPAVLWALATYGCPIPVLTAAWARVQPPRRVRDGSTVGHIALRDLVAQANEQVKGTANGRVEGTVPKPPSISVLASALVPDLRNALNPTSDVPLHPDPPPTRRPSRRAAQRLARLNAALLAAPEPAVAPSWEGQDPDVQAAVEAYRPRWMPEQQWAHMRDLVVLLVAGYRAPSPSNARSTCSHVVAFLVWFASSSARVDISAPVRARELLSENVVEAYVNSMPTTSAGTKATVRAVLRRAVRSLAPQLRPVRLPYAPVSAPYSASECAALIRLARHQPSSARRRNAAFIVALGLGAGLDGKDLREVTAGDVAPVHLGSAMGWSVRVRGGRAVRTVPIRTELVPLLLTALTLHAETGRGPNDPVLGTNSERHSVTAGAVERITQADTATRLALSPVRMRSTWLLAVMCAPVPLADLLQVAGLRSARSLTDLLAYCPIPDPELVTTALREATIHLESEAGR